MMLLTIVIVAATARPAQLNGGGANGVGRRCRFNVSRGLASTPPRSTAPTV